MPSPLDQDYDESAQMLLQRRRVTSSLPPEPQPDPDTAKRQKLAALLKSK